MTMRQPRPRHGDPLHTTQELRELAAAILEDDVQTLARTTAYLRRSYRVVFVGYVAMMLFGVAAVVAAFVKGMTATSVGQAAGVDVDDVMRWGDPVPPMFSLRDPDGNTLLIVETPAQ